MKMHLLTTFLVLAIACAGATPVIDLHGFTYLGTTSPRDGVMAKDFYLSPTSGTHAEGQSACRTIFQGTLATLLTAAHNQELRYFVELNQDCLHIGAERASSSAAFFWTALTVPVQMTFANWQVGQPASSSNCVCVHGSAAAFGWHTCSCTSSYKYVCEV